MQAVDGVIRQKGLFINNSLIELIDWQIMNELSMCYGTLYIRLMISDIVCGVININIE